MNQFYVYIYLNPLKSGDFNYGAYHFNFEPFYVGKGCNSRMYSHLKLTGNNHLKNNKIKKILKSFTKDELKEYIILQMFDLLECQSFKLEQDMIQVIGRRDLNIGPLTNLTNGGDGTSGHKHTEKSKNKMSLNHQDVSGKNNPMFNYDYSKETLDLMSKNNSGNNNPMFGKSGIYKRSEEAKRKMSISKIGKKRTKESRYKQSKSVSGKNNHQAKQIIIDGIKYDTMKEASKRLNISMYKLRKL